MLAILAVAATAGVPAAHSQQIEPIELRVADTFAPGHTFAQDGTPTWIEGVTATAARSAEFPRKLEEARAGIGDAWAQDMDKRGRPGSQLAQEFRANVAAARGR